MVSSRPSSPIADVSRFDFVCGQNKTKGEQKMKSTKFVTQAALIAALYVVLTEICTFLGLSSGVIQLRFSEALTVLPIFTPAAIPGLFAGCIIANILAGGILWDVIFGSLATLIGAVGTYYLGRVCRYLAPIPPIAANTLIIPFVLKLVYGAEGALPFFFVTVLAGEFISCGILGILLMLALEKRRSIFK